MTKEGLRELAARMLSFVSLHLLPGFALAEDAHDAAFEIERARALQRDHAGVDLAGAHVGEVAFPRVVAALTAPRMIILPISLLRLWSFTPTILPHSLPPQL